MTNYAIIAQIIIALLVVLKVQLILLLSAGGLGLLMLLGVAVRIKM